MEREEKLFAQHWGTWLELCGLHAREMYASLFSEATPSSQEKMYRRLSNQEAKDPSTKRGYRDRLFSALCEHTKFKRTFHGKPLTEEEKITDPRVVLKQRDEVANRDKRKLRLSAILKESFQSTPDLNFGVPSKDLLGFFQSLDTRHADADNANNRSAAFELTQALAKGYEITGNWEAAEYNYGILAEEAKSLNDGLAWAEASIRRGIACYHLGRFSAAHEYLEKGLRTIQTRFRDMTFRLQAEARDYASMALFRNDSTQAAKVLKRLKANGKAWEKLNTPLLWAAWEENISIVLLSMGELEPAEENALSGLQRRVAVKAPVEIARSLALLAAVHRERKEFFQAKLILLLAYRLQSVHKDSVGLARTCFELGALHILISPSEEMKLDKAARTTEMPTTFEFSNERQFPNTKERSLLCSLTEDSNYRARSKPFTISGWLENAEYFFTEARRSALQLHDLHLVHEASMQLQALLDYDVPEMKNNGL